MFFKHAKTHYPEVFTDVWFTNDPLFPYSEQIHEALVELPNFPYTSLEVSPSLHPYKTQITKIGRDFSEQFLSSDPLYGQHEDL